MVLPKIPTPSRPVVSGVSRFDEIIGGWYGWAGYKNTDPPVAEQDSGPAVDDVQEGPVRFLKLRARIDAWNLARKLRHS